MTPTEPNYEPVTLGLLIDPSHTHRDRVAHPRPGFIVPATTVDGDALPLHDTPHAPVSPRTSPTAANSKSPFTFAAKRTVHRRPEIRLPLLVQKLVSVLAATAVAFTLTWRPALLRPLAAMATVGIKLRCERMETDGQKLAKAPPSNPTRL